MGQKRNKAFATALLAAAIAGSWGTAPLSYGQQEPAASVAEQPAAKAPKAKDRRKASELFIAGAKAIDKDDLRTAEKDFALATELDPENKNYSGALAVARAHIVTALVQEADKARLTGDEGTAKAKLTEALKRDPLNPIVTQHIYDLTNDPFQKDQEEDAAATIAGESVALTPKPGKQSIHLRSMSRDLIKRTLSLYGIEATIDDSVRSQSNRIDLDDVDFEQAAHIVSMVTGTFFTPLDPKRVLVASDTRENRQKYQRQIMETVYLPGLNTTEMTDMSNMARQVFEAQQAAVQQQNGTLTIRAPERSLKAFNSTLADLLDGHSQVVLDVKMLEVAKTKSRDFGLVVPQQSTAFNVLSEANKVISQNQSTVDQIISSGLAKAGDWQTIAAILIASGAISNSVLSQPFAVFGGGITETGLTLGTVGFNMKLNSSDSRLLDDVRLRVGDQETATLRSGMRYPIVTSSYSSMYSASSTLAGLSSAGLSSSLLSSLGINLSDLTSTATIPQIQYQDLGLTLKATPHILPSGDVAVAIDMKVDALGGGSLNNIPILNTRSFTGTITVPKEQSALLVSNLNKQESKAVSGTPGLGEIPGFSSAVSDKTSEFDVSRLVILITPHIVRRRTNDLRSPIVMLPH